MSDRFNRFINNSFGVILTSITMFFTVIWFVYSLEKRVSLLETHDDFHDKQLIEIKDNQNYRMNRMEDKLDKIYEIVAEGKNHV